MNVAKDNTETCVSVQLVGYKLVLYRTIKYKHFLLQRIIKNPEVRTVHFFSDRDW
jgi:hypothetical protein